MAKTSLIIKTKRKKEEFLKALADGKKPKFPTRIYNRCNRCGRSRGYLGRFDICRICFRELADRGLIPGVRKSSW